MANNLTGDYEAVVQVSIRQINGLLATLQQNGAQENAPLKLLHSATLRVETGSTQNFIDSLKPITSIARRGMAYPALASAGGRRAGGGALGVCRL
jgi:hypothetical protein